ncbi:DUF6090 family protein [Cryomorphaceae bacterium 1068]|nr:DUF6090 family protein [Cryomorphaceae bacterium 1068]
MESKFSKYLLYAIGEIILVVIGILIALQINNWNEGRKEASFEIQILKAFKESLETDLSDVDANINRHQQGLRSADSILVLLESTQSINEDSLAQLFAAAMMHTRFVHSTSAFESLKAKGVNIISNPILQKKIVDVYDSQYSFFLLNEQDFIDQIMIGYNTIMPTRFEESFNIDISTSELTGHLKPLDFEALKKDQEFLYYFKSLRNWTKIMIEFQYAILRSNIVDLQKMIDEEIERIEGL